mgnify:FL=1
MVKMHLNHAQWVIPELSAQSLIEQLMASRALSKKELKKFLHPRFPQSLSDPTQLPDIEVATTRILTAVKNRERIGIFGDYDVDGTCSVTLVAEILEILGTHAVAVKIPDRADGYGLNPAVIDFFSQKKITLLITVDTGTSALNEIRLAHKKGIECIVFDHHEPPPRLARPVALVNPKRPESRYAYRELCATGVVFQWAHYLHLLGKLSEGQLKWMLDLVALATVTDMVPLVADNRVLVHFGLIVWKRSRRIGLNALIEVAGIDRTRVSSYTLGFQIGPRLNAAGRMQDATLSFELLRATDTQAALRLARTLNYLNQRRQQLLEQIIQEATAQIESSGRARQKAIVLRSPHWPKGIVGLVAGRILEKYQRPVVVLEEADGVLTGSARSPEKFHLIEALTRTKGYLERFGGHARAAGLTLKASAFRAFEQAFINQANRILTDNDLTTRARADARITLQNLVSETWALVERFEPFGFGNPKPVFYLPGVSIAHFETFGKDRTHVRGTIGECRVLAFSRSEQFATLKKDEPVEMLITLERSTFQGVTRNELFVRDWRQSK